MSKTSGATSTGFGSTIGINAEFQTKRVNIVCQGLDSRRKLYRITLNKSQAIALSMPTIVDYDIFITSIFHTSINHCLSNIPNFLFIDIARKNIPTIPPHWRSQGQMRSFLRRNSESEYECGKK